MAKGQRPVGTSVSEVIQALPVACSDDSAALAFLETHRWGDTPRCPCCGHDNVYKMTDAKTGEREKNGRLRCRECKERFTVRTGTVMEESRIPLRHWCYALWRATTSKKGVSALEIQRQTGLSYKSSLFLLNRIRFGMQPTDNVPPLKGTVEADETYVGGKPRYRISEHESIKTGKSNKKSRFERHTPVFAAVQRGGEARAKVLTEVNAASIASEVRKTVDLRSRLMTDESNLYTKPGKEFHGGHKLVRHKAHEYVRNNGDIHSNTVEGFFSLLKRSMIGIHHAVSRKHLHRYVAATTFLYNGRQLEDGERVVKCVKALDGKRLTYKASIA